MIGYTGSSGAPSVHLHFNVSANGDYNNDIDHQCNGGTAPGTGCTWRETHDCSAQGKACVDHHCGSGCTLYMANTCAQRGVACLNNACQ